MKNNAVVTNYSQYEIFCNFSTSKLVEIFYQRYKILIPTKYCYLFIVSEYYFQLR